VKAEPSFASRARWTAYAVLRAPFQGRFPYRSPAAINRAQRRRLRPIIEHAFRHVPYYRDAVNRFGLEAGQFETPADLARLPLIDRADLQHDPEYFVSDAAPIDSYMKVQSGGSTGEPITYHRDHAATIQRAIHGRRALPAIASALRKLRPRVVAIVLPRSSALTSEEGFRRSVFLPVSRGTRLILSMLEPPDRLASEINRFKPDLVFGYGSTLENLFIHLDSTGQEFHRPKAVAYGGDSLSPQARRLTEQFGIPVFGNYRAVEAVPIGFECEAHRGFHLNVDLFPVRIVDDDGREVAAGASGEVVISNLVNRGTVLLNYRLGDIARLLPGSCPCGRNLPLMSLIEGRAGDWVISAGGDRVNFQALRYELRDEPIWRYQVVQASPNELKVLVVPQSDVEHEEVRRRVIGKLTSLLGEATAVEVSFVDSLPTTPGGKVRALVSSVPVAG
jgi:phenylacetate-CoA ligase